MNTELAPPSDGTIANHNDTAHRNRWLWLLPVVCIIPAYVAQTLFLTGCRCGEHPDSDLFAFACNWLIVARSVLGIATGRASFDWPIYAVIPFALIPLAFAINAVRFWMPFS